MRKLLWFTAAFSAAVFAVHYGAAPAAGLLLLPALFRREGRPLRCALVCAGLVLGLLWPRCYDALFRAPARAMEGQTLTLTAQVADWPWATARGGGATVRVQPDSGPGFLARLYCDGLQDLRPGDRVTVLAACRSPEVYRGRETDSLTSRGIALVADGQGELAWSRPPRPPVRTWPVWLSRWLKDRVAALFPADTAGLMTALLTGDRSALSGADYAALRQAGLAHAVAVSGMHLAFLVSLAALLLGRHRRRTALIALPLIWLFALAVGAGPAVVRAAVMETLLLLAPLLGRENDPPTGLAFALALLLLQNPAAAGSVSLQLSFAAVAGILACSGRLFGWAWDRVPKGWPRPVRALARFCLSSLSVSCGALVFTTPLSAWYFGSVSLVAPLAGLVCLGAVSLAFSLGLLAAVSGLAPLALPAALLLRYVLWMARALAGLPFSTLSAHSGYGLAALCAGYLILFLFLVQRGPRRPLIPTLSWVLLAALALSLTRLDYSLGPLTLTVMDVGQGQAVLLRSGGRTALVDCGGNGSNAGDLCADYLAQRGGRRLDLLVLTHFHDDHANGVPELLARVPVDVLAAPEPEPGDLLAQEILDLARANGTQIVPVTQDLSLMLGAAQLTLYAPLGAGEANEAGLSLLCRTETFSALFTGDMDQAVEARLVKYGGLPHVDLLAAGHHGAKTSTSQALLDAVTPDLVVVSAGYNTYGHPNPETLGRVQAMGCALCRTDLQGNITVTVG